MVVKELYRTLERGDLDAVCQLLRASTAPTRSSTCCSRAYSLAPAVASHSRTGLNHAGTMGPGGRVTQVHECCRTTLDMTRLAGGGLVVLTARLRAKKAKATCSCSRWHHCRLGRPPPCAPSPCRGPVSDRHCRAAGSARPEPPPTSHAHSPSAMADGQPEVEDEDKNIIS